MVGGVVWLNFFFIPQQRNLSTLSPKLTDLRRKVGQTRQQLGGLPALAAELDRLRRQYQFSGPIPPAEEQLPDLLEKITRAGRSASAQLLVVKSKGDLAQLTPGPSGYLEVPIEVVASAGYHQIGMFLDALERSENLIRIKEFHIEPDPRDIWHHQATFLFQAYLFPGAKKGDGSFS